MANAPTESKVYAATIGGGSGAITTTFLLWILGVTVFQTPYGADSAQAAVLSVPGPVAAFLGLVLTAGGAYVGGWWAKHTPRPATEYLPRRALEEAAATPPLVDPAPATSVESKEYEPEFPDEDEDEEPKNV